MLEIMIDSLVNINLWDTSASSILVLLFILIITLIYLWYNFIVCKKPLLIYQKNEQNEMIVASCKTLTEKFRPNLFVTNAHAMLIIGAIAEGIYHNYFEYQRELLTLKDGGIVSIDWPRHPKDKMKVGKGNSKCKITMREELTEEEREDETPIILCLHGISGSSSVNYMTHLTARVLERGWKQACFNARGCGNTELATPRGFNASNTDDVREVINHIHRQYPRAPLFGVAFSLGANIFTKYLGEEGFATPITAAVTLCNPYNLDTATAHMNSSFIHRSYNKQMAKSLVKYVVNHRDRFSQPNIYQAARASSKFSNSFSPPIESSSSPSLSKPTLLIDEVKKVQSIREFDREYILPQFPQYKTVEEYYKDSSSISYVGGIEIPVLCIQSLDDPLCPQSTWPSAQFFQSKKNLILCATYRGSHVSWIEGSNPFHRYAWSDRAITDYISCILQHLDQFSHSIPR